MLVDPLALVAEAEQLRAPRRPRPASAWSRSTGTRCSPRLTTGPPTRPGRKRAAPAGTARAAWASARRPATPSRYPPTRPGRATSPRPRTLVRKLALLRDRLAAAAGAAATPALPPPGQTSPPSTGAVADRVTLAGDGYLAGLLRAGPGRLRGRPGRAARRVARLPPVHHLVDDDVRERGDAAGESGAAGEATRLGVTRTYQTRHGPGPFPTEDPALPVTEPHNADGRWQGPFRAGHLDAVALGYAAGVAGGVDAVALTHLDTARRCRASSASAAATSSAAAPSPRSSPARTATWPTRSR